VERVAAAPAGSHARRVVRDSNSVSVVQALQVLRDAPQWVRRDAVPFVRELRQRDVLGPAPLDERFQARQAERFRAAES
jgi:hypothetical protein